MEIMPKKAKELSAIEVQRLREAGRYAVGGVAGLHLEVNSPVSRNWILRVRMGDGLRRDIGLGGFPDVALARAKELAREMRERIARGVDPVAERKAARSAMIAARGAEITFAESARKLIDAKSLEWKNDKHRNQWATTLETYANPIIGGMQVRDVSVAHVMKILEPLWAEKTETASRLRGRIEAVLDWATVRGFRSGENPARWKGCLDSLLAKPGKVSKVEHHKALAVGEVGAFMRDLRTRNGSAARALEFLILTAARSGEVRGATWSEVDLEGRVWTIPPERMKAGREHRVPLAPAAIDLLKSLDVLNGNELLFPAPRGRMLSDMSLTAVTRRMEVPAVPHGFRSTFRDWASERTAYPHEVAEMALAHTISNKVEAAYRRGDLFEKRRKMMDDWAKFCGTVQTTAGEVIPIRSTVA
jgi:integrase